MKRILSLLFVICFTFVFVGCENSEKYEAPDAIQSGTYYSLSADKKELNINIENFDYKSGHKWYTVIKNTDVLEKVTDENSFVEAPEGANVRKCNYTATIKGLSEGTSKVIFEYENLNNGSEVETQYILNVHVKSDGTLEIIK